MRSEVEATAEEHAIGVFALITPTDPVAVFGIMKAAGAPEDIADNRIYKTTYVPEP